MARLVAARFSWFVPLFISFFFYDAVSISGLFCLFPGFTDLVFFSAESQVVGESRRKEEYICVPENYCTCYSFFYDIVSRGEELCVRALRLIFCVLF